MYLWPTPASNFLLPKTNSALIDNGYPGANLTSGIYTAVVRQNKGMDGGRRRKHSRIIFTYETRRASLRRAIGETRRSLVYFPVQGGHLLVYGRHQADPNPTCY